MNDRICNRCNQPLNQGQAKFCSHACANRFNASIKATKNRTAARKRCDIIDCDNPARTLKAELCAMHYHRIYRNGTLDRLVLAPKWTDIRGQRFGKLRVTERSENAWLCQCDCGRTTTTTTTALSRGNALSCGNAGCKTQPTARRNDIGYSAVHSRVRHDRGKASTNSCIDCGGPAYQWSYDHEDPDERTSAERNSFGMYYSLKLMHYSPRCVSCHKAFDATRE